MTLVYRNLVLISGAADSCSDPQRIGDEFFTNQASDTLSWLLARARAYAVSADHSPATKPPSPALKAGPLLYPPIETFQRANYEAVSDDASAIASWHPLAEFTYEEGDSTYYNSSLDRVAWYTVVILNSSNDARQFNAAGYGPHWNRVPVPKALTPDEYAWLSGNGEPSTGCQLQLSLFARNLVLESSVGAPCTGDMSNPALVPDAVQHAIDMLSWLLSHVRVYAASAPPSLVVQRDHEFVALVHHLKQINASCKHDSLTVYNELQTLISDMLVGKGNTQRVIALAHVALNACDSWPFHSSPVNSPDLGSPKFLLSPVLEHEGSVRHLVYTDEYNALGSRENLARSIILYVQSAERQDNSDILIQHYNEVAKYMREAPVNDGFIARDIAAIAHAWHIAVQ